MMMQQLYINILMSLYWYSVHYYKIPLFKTSALHFWEIVLNLIIMELKCVCKLNQIWMEPTHTCSQDHVRIHLTNVLIENKSLKHSIYCSILGSIFTCPTKYHVNVFVCVCPYIIFLYHAMVYVLSELKREM